MNKSIYMTYKKELPKFVTKRWRKLNGGYNIEVSLNADCIEIHTCRFCNLVNQNKNFKNELNKIKKAVTFGNKIGLEVHAGHGLTYKSAKILSKTKGIREFNIGHFLIGESIFVGFANSIKQFKKIIK